MYSQTCKKTQILHEQGLCQNYFTQKRALITTAFLVVSSATHRLSLHQVPGGAEVKDGLVAGAVHLQWESAVQCTVHCTVYSVQYSVQCTLNTVHCTSFLTPLMRCRLPVATL